MKKTYINPTMIVVQIEAKQQMLAGSIQRGYTPTSADESDARGFSLFDEDDSEDEY